MLFLRLARRDLRGAIGGFRLLVASVALGTAAIATIALLSAMILDGVRAGGRASIGGDVSLRLFHIPPEPAHLAAFAAAGTATLSAELRPLARHRTRDGERRTLIELKAIDDAYPLYGELALQPAVTPAEALGQRDGLWGAAVAESLLAALDASLGDVVEIGGLRFELRAQIAAEPDRAMRAFELGPRMMVALPAVAGTALVAPGTQTYWYSRIRLPDDGDAAGWIAGFEREFPGAGYRIINAEDGVPGVERSLQLVTSLLLFAAMGMLLIGCVGVGSAVSAYLDGKRDRIAILKSLGARSPLILHLYLAQILAATLCGVAVGLVLAVLTALGVMPLLPDWLPAEPGLQARPLAVAGGFGLLTTVLFALWPLARAERQSPQLLLRGPVEAVRARPVPRRLAAMALIAALLGLLLLWSAPLPVVAALFALAAAVVVLLLLGLGRLVAAAARSAGRSVRFRPPLLRLALANLHRPGAPTAPLVMALGLCLTLLVAVAAIRDNAARHLAGTLPATAPDLVILGIAPEDGRRFDSAMAAQPSVERWERAPFLHGRVERIAGVPVAERRIPAEVAFVIRGDRGLSWRAEPPAGGIVAGTWWPTGYAGPPLASLDRDVARRLGVAVGDSLTLNVLGDSWTVEIASLRRIDWAGLGLDFPILLSPPADPPPHREIAALWTAPGAAAEVQAALGPAFPEAPAIVVDEVIGALAAMIAGVGRVLTAAAAATGLAALLVLGGSVAASRRRRMGEAILMRVLGASRRQVMAITIIEFALIGLATALLSLVLGNVAAWAALAGLVEFRPALGAAMPWVAAALLTLVVTGIGSAWRTASQPPGPILRQP